MMRALFFVVFFLSVWPGGPAASESSLASRVEAFQTELNAITDASGDEDDFSDHNAEYVAAFHHWFPGGVLADLDGKLNDGDLRKVFNTYYNYLIAINQSSGASDLEAILRAIEEAGGADESTIKLMHRFYLTFRRFDDAAAFARSYPNDNLAVPPSILSSEIAAGARPALAPSKDGSVLRRDSIDLRPSGVVVIIGHPLCHFTQNAIADIASEPELADRLQSHAVWLAEPFASLTDGAITEWNRMHPAIQFRYAETKEDWPEINYWGTPTFYFFKNGRLVRKVVGWPRDSVDERKAALWAGLRAIGAAK